MKMVWPACLKRSTAPKRQDQCRFLRECATELETGLTRIFQTSLSSGCLSQDWTNANITPVFKKGDKHIAENYRPVSFTSVTCKRLEQIIYKHLLNHFEQNKILTNLNHSFRSGFSCETQLITTFKICVRTKLFDRVTHSRLTQTKQPPVTPKHFDPEMHESSH